MNRIFKLLPKALKRIILRAYEKYHSMPDTSTFRPSKHTLPRLLFYHVSGFSFAGTEKFLQIIAKYLNKEKYDVFYMASTCLPPPSTPNRRAYLKASGITLVDFDYTSKETTYPYIINGMRPGILEVIEKNEIDMLITAGAGYSEFPFNMVKHLPIILLNIFGSPNMQKNILKNVCISKEVAAKAQSVVDKERTELMYIPSEGPGADASASGIALRVELNIKESDMVFGRIGRPDDGIFDPIGIRAFQQVVQEFPDSHYLIVAPAPALIKIVESEKIPHVHFLPPTSNEERVWAFHHAIDVLAHFRHDGESCGLNIIESMLASKPIISHRSHVWNAHLEYLEPSFSRIAEKDDVMQYAAYMYDMIEAKKSGTILLMGKAARKKSEKEFLIENNIGKFEGWIDEIIARS